jgi:hypothetical protein
MIRLPVCHFRKVICCGLLCWLSAVFAADPVLPLFDAHLHYNATVQDEIPPAKALDRLAAAGIRRAIASASPGQAVEPLYRQDPQRIVPFLRPYPAPSDRYTWFANPELPAVLREQLENFPYRGIGEFHVDGAHAAGEVVQAVIRLARERRLALQAHTDLEGLEIILSQAPDSVVIWAHAGFDVPLGTLRELLEQHPRLYLELSFRAGMTQAGRLTPEWRQFLITYAQRFLVGMDTYTLHRWTELNDLAAAARHWLGQLPDGIATQIGYANADRLFR